MRVTVAVGGPEAGTAVRELLGWLVDEDELKGNVQLADPDLAPGTLGGAVTMAIATLVPGTIGVFASALVAWLRHRTTDVRARVERPDGAAVELSATRVRAMSHEQIRGLVHDLAASLEPSPPASASIDAGCPREETAPGASR